MKGGIWSKNGFLPATDIGTQLENWWKRYVFDLCSRFAECDPTCAGCYVVRRFGEG